MTVCLESVWVALPRQDRHGDESWVWTNLECCLHSPHEGYKHLNPRLQLTVGGMNLPVPEWSPALDKLDVVRCADCGVMMAPEAHPHGKGCEGLSKCRCCGWPDGLDRTPPAHRDPDGDPAKAKYLCEPCFQAPGLRLDECNHGGRGPPPSPFPLHPSDGTGVHLQEDEAS